ncbi:hypothetical protein ACA910_015866 [Epithemia clementina (nom. ined.)]
MFQRHSYHFSYWKQGSHRRIVPINQQHKQSSCLSIESILPTSGNVTASTGRESAYRSCPTEVTNQSCIYLNISGATNDLFTSKVQRFHYPLQEESHPTNLITAWTFGPEHDCGHAAQSPDGLGDPPPEQTIRSPSNRESLLWSCSSSVSSLSEKGKNPSTALIPIEKLYNPVGRDNAEDFAPIIKDIFVSSSIAVPPATTLPVAQSLNTPTSTIRPHLYELEANQTNNRDVKIQRKDVIITEQEEKLKQARTPASSVECHQQQREKKQIDLMNQLKEKRAVIRAKQAEIDELHDQIEELRSKTDKVLEPEGVVSTLRRGLPDAEDEKMTASLALACLQKEKISMQDPPFAENESRVGEYRTGSSAVELKYREAGSTAQSLAQTESKLPCKIQKTRACGPIRRYGSGPCGD